MLPAPTRIAIAPEAAYRELAARNVPTTWWRALARPALALLTIAVVVPMMMTREITAALVVESAGAWGLVVVIQLLVAAVFVAPAAERGVGFWRAMDLWFAGHLPYSLWILLLPFLTSTSTVPPHDVMGVSMIVPLAWTGVIATAFFHVVLGMSRSAARRRAALHLAVVAIIVLALGLWAAGGTSAVLSYIARRLAEPLSS